MADVRIVDSEKAFFALRDEWTTLLSSSPSDNPFLTWEWLFSWWLVYRDTRDLRVVTLRNGCNELVAILPLFLHNSHYYRVPVRECALIGTGLSDRQDIIAKTVDPELLAMAFDRISAHEPTWGIMRFEEIPSDGVLNTATIPTSYSYGTEACSVCPYLKLQCDWNEYLAKKSRSFRRDIARTRDRITSLGSWDLNVLVDPEDVSYALSIMENVELRSQKNKTEKSFWREPRHRDFITSFASIPHREVSIDFSTIRLNGLPIAYLLGFAYKKKFYAYNSAFLDEYRHAAPGKFILQEKIKWCFERKDEFLEFDFSRGDSYVKELWTGEARIHNRIVIFNRGIRTSALRYFVFTARPALKKVASRAKAYGASR